jgi:hypothetical protein
MDMLKHSGFFMKETFDEMEIRMKAEFSEHQKPLLDGFAKASA